MAVIVLILNAIKKTIFWTFEVVLEAHELRLKVQRQFNTELNAD